MSNRQEKRKNQEGAAMVISVLILSVVMLSLALTSSTSFIRELQIIETTKNKKISFNGANACAEAAIDRLGRNINYAGNEIINLGNVSCTILPISSGPPWVIKSQSVYQNQYTRIIVNLSSRSPVVISSWEEVDSF